MENLFKKHKDGADASLSTPVQQDEANPATPRAPQPAVAGRTSKEVIVLEGDTPEPLNDMQTQHDADIPSPPTPAGTAPITTQTKHETEFEEVKSVELPPDCGMDADVFAGMDKGLIADLLQKVGDADMDGLDQTLPNILKSISEEHSKEKEPQPETPDESGRAKLLSEAVKVEGNFDMKGTIGKLWQQSKSTNPSLAQAYAEVGRSYAAQRSFRAEWARKEFAKVIAEKTYSETSRVTEVSSGTYEPFDCIVDREGGPSRRSSMRAATYYVVACLQMHKQRILAMPGTPWVKWNAMTRRCEFFYMKKGCNKAFEKSWALWQRQVSEGDNLPPAIPPKQFPQPFVEGPDSAAFAKEGKAKAKGKAKASPGKVDGGEDEMKKQLHLLFRKMDLTKKQMATATSSGRDLLDLISHDNKWEWAQGRLAQDLQQVHFVLKRCFSLEAKGGHFEIASVEVGVPNLGLQFRTPRVLPSASALRACFELLAS